MSQSVMVCLSVCSHKGGTGKTTTAIHLAAALGHSGWRSLVIDLDPQGFLSRTMGIEEPPIDESVAALFDPEVDFRQVSIQDVGRFDLLPSSSTLTERIYSLNDPTDVLWVWRGIQNVNLEYDLVLFDTAPAMTVYSLNALVASQHVLIPVLPEYQSVVGGERTYQTVERVRERLNRLLRSQMFLLTQVDERKRAHQKYREHLRKKYGSAVLDTVIRTDASLANSQEEGTTVFDYNPDSRGALDYANAADEVAGRVREALHGEREESNSCA